MIQQLIPLPEKNRNKTATATFPKEKQSQTGFKDGTGMLLK